LLLFCSQKRSAFFAFVFVASPALAQQFPQDATPGKCLPAAHIAPGEGAGGNVYASHFGPQPPDAPNSEVATYPDIQTLQPDPIPNDGVPQNDINFQSFPFSGGFNDPALSQTMGPEEPTSNLKGC
jgi:hypothetical protein